MPSSKQKKRRKRQAAKEERERQEFRRRREAQAARGSRETPEPESVFWVSAVSVGIIVLALVFLAWALPNYGGFLLLGVGLGLIIWAIYYGVGRITNAGNKPF